MSRNTILAAALGAAALSSPAAAEPLRIGFLGAEVQHSSVPSALSVDNMSFLDPKTIKAVSPQAQEIGIAAASAVSQARALSPDRQVRIFASNPHYEVPGRRKVSKIAVNYDAASKAIEWFGRNDVKTVVVGFTGSDTLGMRQLSEQARNLGMVLVAPSRADADMDHAFPAAYMQTISVGIQPTASIVAPTVVSASDVDIMRDVGRVSAVSAHLMATDPDLHPSMMCFALTRGPGTPSMSVNVAQMASSPGIAPPAWRGDARVMMASNDPVE